MNELYKKMMLDKLPTRLVINKPSNYLILDEIGFEETKKSENYHVILRFVFDIIEFEQAIKETIDQNLILEKGYLYVAYPKKGNKHYKQYIDRDSIVERFNLEDGDGFVSDSNLKFSKMFSMDDIFTVVGIKNTPRKDYRVSNTSACVDDYIDKIPNLRKSFGNREEILSLFDNLSFGYQKDWARYVYSAKTVATIEKRLLEMADILSAGYKTKNLYLQSKK